MDTFNNQNNNNNDNNNYNLSHYFRPIKSLWNSPGKYAFKNKLWSLKMKTSKWFNNVEGPVSELLEGLISASKEMLSSSGKNAKQPNLFHLSQSLQSLPVLALLLFFPYSFSFCCFIYLSLSFSFSPSLLFFSFPLSIHSP